LGKFLPVHETGAIPGRRHAKVFAEATAEVVRIQPAGHGANFADGKKLAIDQAQQMVAFVDE
jgi:hypothetical protein